MAVQTVSSGRGTGEPRQSGLVRRLPSRAGVGRASRLARSSRHAVVAGAACQPWGAKSVDTARAADRRKPAAKPSICFSRPPT